MVRLIILFLLTNTVFAQDATITAAGKLYISGNYETLVSEYKQEVTKLDKNQQPILLLLLGKAFENLNKEDSAFLYYKKALKGFNEIKKEEKAAEVNLAIYSLLNSQKKLNTDKMVYLNNFLEYAETSDSKKWKAVANKYLGIEHFKDIDPNVPQNHFLKSLALFKEIDSTLPQVNLLSNLGVLYQLKKRDCDSARLYLNQALKTLTNDSLLKDELNLKFNIYNNIGNTYKQEEKFEAAVGYFIKAAAIPLLKHNNKSKQIVYTNLEKSYYGLKKYDSAYSYLKKIDSLENEVNLSQQNTQIMEVLEKYDNEKLRADNLEIESKRTQNRNIAIGMGGGVLGVALIGFLLYKNTRRKQRIAEQQSEIEIQKTEKILKEQELTTIDAMIAGQEKERERLASDLHDSVGATLAAAKLQFNHLKTNKGKLKNEDELFEKTSILLNDAYTEIRNMAHVKNSGVIAKNGLLPAVEKLAKNASGTNSLTIEVQDFGLDERLENSMEIAVFRVIQELVTNIIKHSKASEASISITQHKDMLSIIVEDNGKGFDAKKIHDKDGMGLANIERRVEHLEGSMEVDSTKGKGTTVLIDIPL